MQATGSFAFVLHSHIPYVLAHGQWPHGTDWLTEVAAESYIPILDALHDLIADGVRPKLTIGLTPILCEQLADDSFKDEFTDWLEANIGHAAADARAFRAVGQTDMLALANRWRHWFRHILNQWENVYQRDIVGAFGRLQNEGCIEILTSAATHGYLPLIGSDACVGAQVQAGIASYVRHFGRKPTGFWLPECAYRPRYHWQNPLPEFRREEPWLRRGVDEFLADAGIEYTFVDRHLVRGGEAQGVYADRFGALKALWHQFAKEYTPPATLPRSEYRPYFVASSGQPKQTPVAVFSRDARSSHAVWAADIGYPGDSFYLEFHKKREPGRLRYWRVSYPKDDMAGKQPYEPHQAYERTLEHARHFVGEMRQLFSEHQQQHDAPAFVTAMYDTELFGHWWHEGPLWLKEVLRLMATDQEIDLTTCAAYLDRVPAAAKKETISLPEGSWGEGGFHWIWLNPETQWMWEAIYASEQEMTRLVQEFGSNAACARPLRQAARELLLLESSDWPFVTSTHGAPDYAEARVKVHHVNFQEIAKLVRAIGAGEETDTSPWQTLAEVEKRDNPFPDINPRWWGSEEPTDV